MTDLFAPAPDPEFDDEPLTPDERRKERGRLALRRIREELRALSPTKGNP